MDALEDNMVDRTRQSQGQILYDSSYGRFREARVIKEECKSVVTGRKETGSQYLEVNGGMDDGSVGIYNVIKLHTWQWL